MKNINIYEKALVKYTTTITVFIPDKEQISSYFPNRLTNHVSLVVNCQKALLLEGSNNMSSLLAKGGIIYQCDIFESEIIKWEFIMQKLK